MIINLSTTYHSNEHLQEFYPQDGGENQLA